MTEFAEEFECACRVDRLCSDDPNDWPLAEKRVTDFAIERLLKRYPQAEISEDKSFCMAPGHPHYPENGYGKFFLVRRILLKRAIAFEDEPA